LCNTYFRNTLYVPGGSLWRTWKPKRPSTTKTHVNYNSNRVAQKYHRSHVEYDVRKNNERNEEVPYCAAGRVVLTFELNREGSAAGRVVSTFQLNRDGSAAGAEEIGFLKTIYVNKTYSIKDDKFTTENGGTSIRVRGGSPGGSLWRTWKPKRPST
jgi:hypothetical protein